MRESHRQELKALSNAVGLHRRVARPLELPQAHFGCDLPGRGSAYENRRVIVLDKEPYLLAQGLATRRPPNERVRVEEDFCSNHLSPPISVLAAPTGR